MKFSNVPMDVMGIIQILLPVITFVMGYLLTGIEHKRYQKLSIVREKFEKLYHPFYMLVNELGTDAEEGVAINTADSAELKQFFNHVMAHVHLASTEGQRLFWEARLLFVQCMGEGDALSEEKEQLLGAAIGALFGHLVQEYMKAANTLGYDISGEVFVKQSENAI